MVVMRIEDVERNGEVENQVAIEDEDVPGQHGTRPVHHTDERHEVPQALRAADVDHDEANGHDKRGDGERFAHEYSSFEIDVVQHVRGHDEHHSGGGDADEESEVGDVESPTDLVVHAGDNQPITQLNGVGEQAGAHDSSENAHPD